MNYSVQKLADLAGVSVRTLHYYDEIGLLTPRVNPENKYRQYGEGDLLRLQQILFFRELEFSLEEIKKMMEDHTFDKEKALKEQKKMLLMKRGRLDTLIKTIETTIEKGGDHMSDDQKFSGFSTAQMDEYKEEAKKRWGHTDAWKQSQERTKNWTKEDYARVKREGEEWTEKLAALMTDGKSVESEDVQQMIAEHYNGLRRFYEPNLELYQGLGEIYVSDPRFTAYYERHKKGLANFMRNAMIVYVKNHQ